MPSPRVVPPADAAADFTRWRFAWSKRATPIEYVWVLVWLSQPQAVPESSMARAGPLPARAR